MSQIAELLIAIGCILLLGLATNYLGKRTFLPRVTLLLIFGVIVGNEVFDMIPVSVTSRFEIITDIALLMIAFLLGGKLTFKSIKKDARQVIGISLAAALGTVILVTLALVAFDLSLEVAILLGCISVATDPAATLETVLESNSKSRFSRLLLSIVAIDDVWALILFSLGLAFVSILNGAPDSSFYLYHAIYEIMGALLLGGIIGFPAAYLTGRIKSGQPMLTEALGLVLICGGVSIWIGVSFLIAAMTMGAVIANFAKHHDYPFHEIENIESPFIVLFFILAGAKLEFDMMFEVGLVGLVYIIARFGGKFTGAWIGAGVTRSSKDVQRWMGLALMPQAGVAIGMALLVANRFPEYQQTILSIVIGTTVFFELIGPVITRFVLKRTE